MTTPGSIAPTRPHLPARCTYSFAFGTSNEYTCATFLRSKPRLACAVHTIIDALPLSKSSTTLIASRPSGRSVTSVCAPHNALRRGPATISAAGASFTNTSVRGGGLSSPAAIASARICRHKVTNFLPCSEYNTRW